MYNGNVAVVTGGASGIGRATVLKLCQNGYSAAIVYNSSEAEALSFASELSFNHYKAAAFRCNIADSREVEELKNKIISELGKPLLLVNNAGIAQQKLFTDITDDDWNRMISVNLSGAFYMCRAFLPFMIHEKRGKIINISSMWGQTGASCEVHYSAAKAGLIGLTKALAKEVAPSGITVNCIAPGAIDTNMMASFSAEDKAALCEEIPLERLGTASEIAEVVAFLASNAADYITGQVMAVNGGMVI